MSVVPDFYVAERSWLHSTDPRVKLLMLALSVVLLLVFKNLWVMLTAWLLLLAVYASARVPPDRIRFLFKALLPVVILMPLIWVIFYPEGDPIISFGFINLRGQSLAEGLTVSLRILAMTFSIFAVLFTTKVDTLVQGLVKLKMPYSWGLILSLALRYVPNFANSFTSIRQAQQARGLEYESSRGLKRVRNMMPVLVPMIIGSFRGSEQTAIALEARGYGKSAVRRTFLNVLQMRVVDWAIVAIGLAVAVGLLALNIGFGIGSDPILLFP